jgi:hypothetical protein
LETTTKKERKIKSTEINYSIQGSGTINLGKSFKKWPESNRPHGPMPDMKLLMVKFWEHPQM